MSFLYANPTKARRGARAERMAQSTSNYLCCPQCGGELKSIVDSRPTVIGSDREMATRRRRLCMKCGERATTIEVTEEYLERLRAETLKEIALAIIAGEIK